MRDIMSEKEVVELLENRLISLKLEIMRTEEALTILRGKSQNTNAENKRIVTRTKVKKSLKKPALPTVYDPKYKWEDKILFALSKTGPAFKEDIIKEIGKLEPGEDIKKLGNSIAVKLSNLLHQNTIKGEREGRKLKYQLP